ncbi:ABC transporter ATP-binding protein [Shouchella clausii]|uniref:ABC transporter ATP-binding protein n=1 Tax=Shouchella clausii TaxID=79880 RepID=UPI000788F206|nr:ABC transporter ATP-binding protein [Shouchella clausii]AST96389.1 aliphatic sulfonate ABC transporter ATP-binding protein [Shouchella clausii]MCR1287629.1 ABC transporter ATP-binding protein [Shouchella clausii]MEB5471324.1 ABC transporter ATP-binding protein [Shouchella clausii]MED4160432.1 ABC transporter ATP-binding protein [Shouchella clausii]MED4175733.1 ABC transporter ATP-binding protein [Shouchella clausii]
MATELQHGAAIEIDQLYKQFGNKNVLQGIDATIHGGEFVAVVGKSGCGKSTLLRHVAGLETATSGEVRQNGERIDGINQQARLMFQESRLLPWQNVLTNVGVGLRLEGEWQQQAAALLKDVGLDGRGNEWPAVLSGGQKQRVALARALAGGPKLLLLDEPLGALDALTRMEMQQLVERLWLIHRFTALLVTHDVSEAVMLADRIIVIEEGRIVMTKDVPLPRPRVPTAPDFADIQETILNELLGIQAEKPLLQQTN